GNPLEGQAGALAEVWSLGHRNVQGLAFRPGTDDLYISEMGPRGGDEINLILPGRNSGWPVVSYGEEYSGMRVGQGIAQMEGMEEPVYYWDPVIAPSGIAFGEGGMFPEWEGSLFVGGLAGSHISRLVIEDGRVTGEERLLESERQRFRDVAFGPDGTLYAVTDAGRLYRVFR
ncbi:MAG TPA: PQQ-dependent sugar dehydrogenase, partial [Candidatus Limnocylindria bacterium]|nr:PQQ-dependent sugar dehydrogenase [Candidatus Limnocylindria bacterium]